MDTTIDTQISTICWLERLARLAKDNDTPLAEAMNITTWSDVNMLMNSQVNLMLLSYEISVMVAQINSRKAELVVQLSDKV